MKNLLVVIDDQHRHDCLGCARHPVVQTPNLDALAKHGVRFTSAVSNPPCVPSRYSFMTGYYPHQTGILTNAHVPDGHSSAQTLGHRMKKAGYHTAAVGKMHWNTPEGRFGFDWRAADDFYGDIEGELDIAYCDTVDDRIIRQRHLERDPYFPGGECADGYIGGVSPVQEKKLIDTWTTDHAVDFLAEYDGHKPFCLVVSFDRPHAPMMVPASYEGMYDPNDLALPPTPDAGHQEDDVVLLAKIDKCRYRKLSEEDSRMSMARYYANITYIDSCVGRLTDILKRRGRWEDTALFFFSDHGEMLGDHGCRGKLSLYDNAIRVPLIVRWPGVSKPGHVCHAPVELTDLMPTWLEVADQPACADLPGRSLSELLRGRKPVDLNWRTGSYSELHHTDVLQRAMREKRFKLIERHGARSALYDLQNDPHEFHNLIDHAGSQDVLNHLRKKLLDRMMAVQGRSAVKRWPS